MTPLITEHVVKSERTITTYLEAGPPDGPLIVMVHGYPDLATSWRHQMHLLASMGFRAVAPNMRGYAGSSVPDKVEGYAIEESVADLIELIDALGADRAVWVGHDCGAAAVWGLATHHPDRCLGVAGLCVPYLPQGFTLETVAALANRDVYPADRFPWGQWGYWGYQVQHPADSDAQLDSDPESAIKMIFQRTSPASFGTNSGGDVIGAPHGWSPILEYMKSQPISSTVLSEEGYWAYVASVRRNGFGAINNYYRNGRRNAAYAATAVNEGRIDMPVLFIHAKYDRSCVTIGAPLADPMRAACPDLMEAVVEAGHWVQQEKPMDVNASLVEWLARRVPGIFAARACAADV